MMLFFLIACSGTSTKNTDTAATSPEWFGEIQPLVAENCAQCHFEGGSSPFPLETYEQVQPLASVMLSSIQSGSMPPWLPNQDCGELQAPRVLTQNQIARFAQWVDNDTPIGDSTLEVSPIPIIQDITPTHSVQMPSGFIPNTEESDQYRCFPLELQFDEETFITQTQVIPGSGQVHHVLIYALDPSMADAIQNANGADGTVGYPCFGDPFPSGTSNYALGFPTQIGAWVPGIEPAIFPEGTALRIKPNAVVVMQVHYSALGGESTEDSSSYHIVTTDIIPDSVAQTRPLAIQDLDIPPGATASFNDTFVNYYDRPIEVRSFATHMHMLGTEQKSVVHRNDGTEECLLHISDWDFAWQQAYLPENDVFLASGESIEVTCTYDNSQENQPIINGEQLAPAHVEWGDGTLDEMCLLYTTLLEPYRPLPPQGSLPCYGIDECIADCGDSLSCLLSCEQVEFSCLTCTLDGFLNCGISQCAIEGLQAESCLRDCYSKSVMMGSPIGSCLEKECPTEYSNLIECADPVLRNEECSATLEACGIPLSE
jgi:hypothetical protein